MDFETALEKSKAMKEKASPEDYLEFYGYYKQATEGDCNIETVPTDATEKAKYESWSKHKGISQEAAKAAFVAIYEKYAPKYA